MHKLAEVMYKAAAGPGQAGPMPGAGQPGQGAGAAPGRDDVIDAEFEEA